MTERNDAPRSDVKRHDLRIAGCARVALVPYLMLLAWAFLWPVAPVQGPGRSDLLAHWLLFVGLGVLLALASSRWRVVLIVGSVVAIVAELWQLGIPGRRFDEWDMAANVVGVMAVAGVWRVWGERVG